MLISCRIQFFGCRFRRKLSHYSHIILSSPPLPLGGALTCVSPLSTSHGPHLSPREVGGGRDAQTSFMTDPVPCRSEPTLFKVTAGSTPSSAPVACLYTLTHTFFSKHKALDLRRSSACKLYQRTAARQQGRVPRASVQIMESRCPNPNL